MQRIAVIGAGLAGLVVANGLTRQHRLTVFEKSRGVGGRMATRYAGEYRFDHGAQFFTARSRAFRDYLQPHVAAGDVAIWRPQFVELRGAEVTASRAWDESPRHYVAVPGMNALAQRLAEGLDVRLNTAVAKLERRRGQWLLRDEHSAELGCFDWVIVTAPATQTASLAGPDSALGKAAVNKKMLGCYALMLGFQRPLPLHWQAALVRNADISWISVNSSKPGRGEAFTLVVHSTNQWAEAHMEDELNTAREHLVAEVSQVTGQDCGSADHCVLHRWRYANIDRQPDPRYFIEQNNRLAACGDWFIRGRIEAAFQSAHSLLAELDSVLPT